MLDKRDLSVPMPSNVLFSITAIQDTLVVFDI